MATETKTISAADVRRPKLRERLDLGSGLLPYLLIIPTILVILVVAVYPILDSIWLSMLESPGLPAPSAFIGLEHYVQLFQNSVYQYGSAIGSTLIFFVVSVALETVLGLGVAILINKTFPGRGLVRAAILVPWAFPTIVSAYIWQLMYNDQTGVITYILQGLHILAPGSSLLDTTPGIIIGATITDVWKTTPFMALLLLAGLQVIPKELYEAGNVDGTSRWQRFSQITLPMIKNVLLIAMLFRALDAIRVFDLFYALGQRQTQSMGSNAFFLMFAGPPSDFGPGLASAVIIFVLGIVISLVFVSQMRGIAQQV
jgi:ABC-type sugar transport system permease subunit